MNLFDQFRKKANFYFLIIAVLSFTPYSPKPYAVDISAQLVLLSVFRWFISVLPLVFVLSVSGIKEAFEYYQRSQQDKAVNSNQVRVFRENDFKSIAWEDLTVGDLIKIRTGTFNLLVWGILFILDV